MSDIVICTKCKTENPAGQDHCNSCGSLLPGHSFGFDKHPENIGRNTSQQKKEIAARKLVEGDGVDWDTLEGSERMLALACVSAKATAADRKAYMQHVVQKLKPAPKIGKENEQAIEKVVIEAAQIDNAMEALEHLKAFTNKRSKK